MTPKQNECLVTLHDTLMTARKNAKDVRGAAIGNHDLTNTMLQMDAFLVVLQRVIDDYYLRDKPDLNLKADPNG